MHNPPDSTPLNTPDFSDANLLVRAPQRRKTVEWTDEYFEPKLVRHQASVQLNVTAPVWSALHD